MDRSIIRQAIKRFDCAFIDEMYSNDIIDFLRLFNYQILDKIFFKFYVSTPLLSLMKISDYALMRVLFLKINLTSRGRFLWLLGIHQLPYTYGTPHPTPHTLGYPTYLFIVLLIDCQLMN